jgi:hypothetical protein
VKPREDIHELTNDELATPLDELACVMREDMASPRCAEILTEAANRLRGKAR